MPGSRSTSPDPPEPAALDAALRRLHGCHAPGALSVLHERAAMLFEGTQERFHLTHAWVFALEAGEELRAEALEARLKALERPARQACNAT